MSDRLLDVIEMEDARVEVSGWTPGGGVGEYHLMAHVTDPALDCRRQMEALENAYEAAIRRLGNARPVFCRYFLSDAANQAQLLETVCGGTDKGAVSVVQQPPLDGTKVALWTYLLTDVETRRDDGLFEVRHGSYRHYWMGGGVNRADGSERQTRLIFDDYVSRLAARGCSLKDNCLRTWLFVQNIDLNYAGVVKARNEVFRTQGLTADTHFIASTGIGGRTACPQELVQMDAYAVDGLQPGQVRHLYAPTHLNPTYEYGVSFERGTRVDYGDRRHVFISGTASINNKGEVVHPGDVRKQTQRMWENVETLLDEAGCSYGDVGQMIVYLRDRADYAVVKALYDGRFPATPKVFVDAAVCRPAWLIEMECMAMKRTDNAAFAPL